MHILHTTGRVSRNSGGDTCYFIDSHKLISTNLKAIVADASTKPTVKVEASLIKQTARSGAFGSSVVVVEPVDIIVMGNPFPFIVSYWDGKNRFIVPYATLKDCSPSSYDPKNVIEVSLAMWPDYLPHTWRGYNGLVKA